MENFDLYKSIKVKRFKLSDKENKFTISKDFDKLDSYQNNIKKYIYTGIKLSDHTESQKSLSVETSIVNKCCLTEIYFVKKWYCRISKS